MTADLPLNIDEAEGLVATGGKGFVKDAKAVMHFVRRAAIKLRADQDTMMRLHQEVQAAHLLRNDRLGQATGLNPLQALAYLSDEQLAAQFKGLYARMLSGLRKAVEDTNKARQTANADVAKVRLAVAKLLEDPALDENVRSRFQNLLNTLPQPATELLAPPPQLLGPDGQILDTDGLDAQARAEMARLGMTTAPGTGAAPPGPGAHPGGPAARPASPAAAAPPTTPPAPAAAAPPAAPPAAPRPTASAVPARPVPAPPTAAPLSGPGWEPPPGAVPAPPAPPPAPSPAAPVPPTAPPASPPATAGDGDGDGSDGDDLAALFD